jgi:hypothetical protein
MTHRTVVNCETGEVTQVEYTPEEQAAHDAAVAAQQAEAQALAAEQAEQPTEEQLT